MIKWWIIIGVIAFLSMDFWNWNKSQPFISFLPFWAWQIFFITLLFSAVLAAFAGYGWRNKND